MLFSGMSSLRSKCPHIDTIGDYTKEDIIEKQLSPCDTCGKVGSYLWVCLHRNCLNVGCNDSSNNHCVKHFHNRSGHCLFLNLTTLRVFCLICENEVFLENNDPPLPGMLPQRSISHKTDSDSDDEWEANDESSKPRGLTGLQNLGNTCYMNSAIQALSNCPPLTNFFLECGPLVCTEKKVSLAKSYMMLMKEMWHRKRPSYVVPSGIAYGIKLACPMFRGYTQQDAQEFLRCFMDQLHEELKEPIVESCPLTPSETHEELDSGRGDSAAIPSEENSHSDLDYETCESGFSSEKDSCVDEGVDSLKTNTDPSLPPTIQMDLDNSTINDTTITNESQTTITSETHTPSLCVVEERYNTLVSTDSGYVSKGDHNFDADYTEPSSSTSTWQKGRALPSHLMQSNQLMVQSAINQILTAKKKPTEFSSVISDIFDGKILSSVQCLTCDTVSTTKETFQDLSLPIPNRDHLHMIHASQGHQKSSGTCTDVYTNKGWLSSLVNWVMSWFWGPSVNLQDCLSAFFSADELKGDNMYSCEKCKKLRNGIKYSKVIELPEVLCIHLKRFRHEVMFSSKISNYVAFPLEGLDLSPFLHKTYQCSNTTYDLASVICHHGTAGYGHYTAYCLNYTNDRWYEFDDQYVTAVDPEVVRNCEAYVLFYRKSGEDIIKKRLCAVELMERSGNESGLLKFHISRRWVNKFNNFADPGPISNTDFLCAHGGVSPEKAPFVDELCTVLPQAVWEYLHDTFSGGPPCTHLYICTICQAEQDALSLKRKTELEDYKTLNYELQSMDSQSNIYAICSRWFKSWESFVCRNGEPPGPIDNSSICTVKNNQAVLKHGSDYCSVSKEIYEYFQTIYGGGPHVTQQPIAKTLSVTCAPYSSPVNTAKSQFMLPNTQVHSSAKDKTCSSHTQSSACSSTKTLCDDECRTTSSDQGSKTSNPEERISNMLNYTKL